MSKYKININTPESPVWYELDFGSNTSIGTNTHVDGLNTVAATKGSSASGILSYSGYAEKILSASSITSCTLVNADHKFEVGDMVFGIPDQDADSINPVVITSVDVRNLIFDKPINTFGGTHEYVLLWKKGVSALNTTPKAIHAEGYNTIASGNGSHAEGYSTRAINDYSHAEGYKTTASGLNSHTEGWQTEARGDYSHAEGFLTKARGDSSHAEGKFTYSGSSASHAEGSGNVASGAYSHAEGLNNVSGYAEKIVSTSGNLATFSTNSLLFSVGEEVYAYRDSYDYPTSMTVTAVNGNNLTLSSSITGYYSIARIGGTINGNGVSAHVEGSYNIARGISSHVEGSKNNAVGNYSHGEGYNTVASGIGSHAEGSNTVADGNASHTEGYQTTASGVAAHAEGDSSMAYTDYAHVEGRYALAAQGKIFNVTSYDGVGQTLTLDSVSTLVVGSNIIIKVKDSISVEDVITAINGNVITLTANVPTSSYSNVIRKATGTITPVHAEGLNTIASGIASHAEGEKTTASGNNSHAEGYQTTASGDCSHAEGKVTIASGADSHAEGDYTLASGSSSHAEGHATTASGTSSHAEGNDTTASGDYSHAEGLGAIAVGTASHAEGSGKALGDFSHAEGRDTFVGYQEAVASYTSATATLVASNHFFVVGDDVAFYISDSYLRRAKISLITNNVITFTINPTGYSKNIFLMGRSVSGKGAQAHAEGKGTIASGSYSHAEGEGTTASGSGSHAEGSQTTASGYFSHTSGLGTAAKYCQTVIGRYNTISSAADDTYSDTNELFIIGNGTGTGSRGSAFKILGNGSTYADGAYASSGADYAEMFEWLDGNLSNEDRVGHFVTLDGEKIRKANSQDSYILGVVSANPSIVGDAGGLRWKGKYIADDWGRTQYHFVTIPEELDEKGNVKIPERLEWQPKINPNWINDENYVERSTRPEWSAIGLMGKLLVRDDGTCVVNGYCKSNDNGEATKSNVGYKVMKRVTPSIIQILVK
ncbi:exosporium leader peptide [Paenibacillus sp. SYP-B3998]|uniref:Exosporium leader peptide n=1 Tax=Paenibacillus sp. SYP-B3998 TaxID=2678564 RepID=A0A6G4A1Q7_9BACL|nr:peptidase G2 autoproteolytic cleavage domain-containing protein [Paenibacillus sp. SYP-B3998]NEW08228.1 exosporium leader peptide [Paenibacillus sp. SYP-B3998]